MSHPLKSTPRQDGYRMPAEFEPHARCWMLWPERGDNWRLNARPAQVAFAAVAAAIARFELVRVGASAQQLDNARQLLDPIKGIHLVELASDDAWMRDCGPTFVVDGRGGVRGVDWEFNAWGGLYASWDQDAQVAQKVLEMENLERYQAPGFVLEGGSIATDGQGTLLTTEECLLNPNRNPTLSQAEIEVRLRDYLGVEKIIWLGQGVYADETSGHVDNLCCFASPGVVALAWTDDPADPQHAISRDAFERLSRSTDARGHRLEIVKLHQPAPLYMTAEQSQGVAQVEGTQPRRAGDRLAASYVNFYSANGGVIAPQFGDPHDITALETLSRLFPRCEVVGVPAREILLGGGGIHCITLQQPAGLELGHGGQNPDGQKPWRAG